MNTATKVGEIFTKAGDSYNKIGDMIIMLAPAAHELIAIDEKNAIYYDVSKQNVIAQLIKWECLKFKFTCGAVILLNFNYCTATATTNNSTSQWQCYITSTTVRYTASDYTYTGTVCSACSTTAAGRGKVTQ